MKKKHPNYTTNAFKKSINSQTNKVIFDLGLDTEQEIRRLGTRNIK